MSPRRNFSTAERNEMLAILAKRIKAREDQDNYEQALADARAKAARRDDK